MTLFIFKYALPALLGYTLFVGIAGKYNPFHKPHYLEERPSWMLGLWTGMSVLLVLSIGLHMAYGMTLEAARSLAAPSVASITLLLTLGFIGYLQYQRKILATVIAGELHPEHHQSAQIDWATQVHQLAPIINRELSERVSTQSALPEPFSSTMPELSPDVQTDSATLSSLRIALEKEKNLRQETEQHLRITRKALSTLHQLTPASPDESVESSVANLKRELIKTKREIRLHVAARAKALSTANRSVAFARQSIELRARLETELETAHSALAIRQNTISSLIARLERERRLTDEELDALAKHVAINDPELTPVCTNQITPDMETQHSSRSSANRT